MENDETEKQETTNEEKGENNTPDTSNVETSPGTSPIIEAARKENDRKEELLKKEEELISRRERLQAEAMVGGRAEAGQGEAQQKEETDHEYRKRIEKEISEGKYDKK